MLLARDVPRHEDAEMPDCLVDGVDDRLPMRADVIDVLIEIEDPAERLLWRGDVIALGAEHNDRRTDVAQVDGAPSEVVDQPGRQPIADEQLVHDELYFFGIEVDMAAPPPLEFEIALASVSILE